MFSERRVHRLKLRSSSPEAIQHGAIVVEDALRTASVSGLPLNGLLLIRRLDLGKLAVSPTSTSVARRIANLLLASNVSIIRPNTAEQPRADIVWFADIIEPYVILAALLSQNFIPQSWYWPRAVHGWSDRMDPEQSLRHVLFEVSRTPAGIAGATRVLEQVISVAGVDVLGRTLQPRDGQTLLALSGIHTPNQTTADNADDRIPGQIRLLGSAWRQALIRLMPQWGRQDDRTTWLAHVAVCARRGMPSACAAAVLQQELQKHQPGSSPVERQKQVLPLAPKTGIPAAADYRRDGTDSNRESPTPKQAAELHQPLRSAGPQAKSDKQASASSAELPQATNAVTAGGTGQTDRLNPNDRSGIKKPENAILHQRSAPATHEDLNSSNAARYPIQARPDASYLGEDESVQPAGRSALHQNEQQPCRPRKWTDTSQAPELAGVESQSAGLVFILQVLEWLELRETLKTHLLLEMYQLPARILWHCVDQLEISHHDPICDFLPPPEPVSAEESFDFVAPLAWQNYCWPSSSEDRVLTIARIRNTPGKRILHNADRNLTIALWKNQIPSAARPWLKGCVLQRQSMTLSADDLNLIIDAYMSAIDIFLRKYAHTTLRRMVTRPGHVATTRTHLDVTFDQAQLDIGIRKAGLDIDPGWIPWLGRVVYIHYQGREEIIDV